MWIRRDLTPAVLYRTSTDALILLSWNYLSCDVLFTSLGSHPLTRVYWGARNPRRTTCNGGQEPADVN